MHVIRIKDLLNRLKAHGLDGEITIGKAVRFSDNSLVVPVQVGNRVFMITYYPQRYEIIIGVKNTDDATPKIENMRFQQIHEAIIYVLSKIGDTPTKVGFVAKWWLFIRPYVLRIVKWRKAR